jgi:hypothetical protein
MFRRAGRAALIVLPLVAASTSVLAADPDWVAIGDDGGVTVFQHVERPAQPDDEMVLAARAVRPAPTPVQVAEDGALYTYAIVPEPVVALAPAAPTPVALYDNGDGLVYFAP